MGAGEGRYAEVVYTTLPVLVEMTIWRFTLPICRSFGLKFALFGKLTASYGRCRGCGLIAAQAGRIYSYGRPFRRAVRCT